MANGGLGGSVNVLTLMGTDLFDESQENPFLLQQRSPSTPKRQLDSPYPPQRSINSLKEGELPLDDVATECYGQVGQSCLNDTPSVSASTHSTFTSPLYSPGCKVSFAARDINPHGVLGRRSSCDSTMSSCCDQSQLRQATDSLVTDSELLKLLYSLAHFGLAGNDASPTGNCTKDQFTQSLGSKSLSFCAKGASSCNLSTRDEADERRAPQRASMTKRRRSSQQDSIEQHQDSSSQSRGSVTFETVRNLLRGGGLAGRTAFKHKPEAQHEKCMGTISSRAKINQKFVRPAIHTDAFHRVNTMKLGTPPLRVREKYVAFPKRWKGDILEREEADSAMPSPKGQLRMDSFITLETLDKIGTRAACPVHLIDEEKPDYSNVSARVDSYNHVRSPKRGLQRPSTWLTGAALDARVAYYEEHR